ncbi:MAG: hypothetical protein KJZ65_11790 [Phycisphaerales bacterium]|nr:hypothetical protein [Phycisphaerales bacterium]
MSTFVRVALAASCISTGTVIAGPDLIVADIPTGVHWGSVDGVHAFSFGQRICNLGDARAQFTANTNAHPVFTQNLYRLSGGRFEQIGLSFAFHGIFALEQNFCGSCSPVGGGSLGPGCSDVNSASIVGSQQALGPRSEIDPQTGDFPYPFTGSGQTGDAIFRRLQAREPDLETPGAQYFVETLCVAPDEAPEAINNNTSWRRVSVAAGFNITPTGSTVREQAGIFAWAAHSGATVQAVDVPGDGRFFVGSFVTSRGDGTWSYEYAVQNLNCTRAGGGFRVPGHGASITDIGFHDVDYHSGEPFDGSDWPGQVTAEAVSWSTVRYDVNPNANALRWGTLYNFRFVADRPPRGGVGTLTLFAPGDPASVQVIIDVPTGSCAPDWNHDGVLDFFDVAAFLDAFSLGNEQADLTGDGLFDFFDVLEYLRDYSAGCS